MPSPQDIAHCTNLDGQIKLEEKFATGGHGELYLGKWSNPRLPDQGPAMVAVKKIRGWSVTKDSETFNKGTLTGRLNREATVWNSLSHTNVLTFLGIWHDTEDSDTPCFVSPFLKYGHALDYLKAYPNTKRIVILRGIASGLAYLHSRDPDPIIHGDLKPVNVVIDEGGVARLCDFGRGKIMHFTGYTTATSGTNRYLAPELSDPDVSEPKLSLATDVYSFAVTSLEILTGKDFLPRYSDTQIVAAVILGRRPKREDHQSSSISDDVWELLAQCWDKEPTSRPAAAQVAEAISLL